MTPRRRARGLRVTHRGPAAGGELVELVELAREAGVRAESAWRFVALGLPEPSGGTRQLPRFSREAAALLATAERLRRDLGLNHAGAVLACELLARIEELEAQLESLRLAGHNQDDDGRQPAPPKDRRPREQ
jgi:chaperone modulatory protein CbpM